MDFLSIYERLNNHIQTISTSYITEKRNGKNDGRNLVYVSSNFSIFFIMFVYCVELLNMQLILHFVHYIWFLSYQHLI